MSTITSTECDRCSLTGPTYLLIRRLQSLTGLMFGGYVLVHLLVNATIFNGGNEYQDQVNKIHSLPFLQAIEWSAIFLPFLIHAIYGLWITINGRPNNASYPYAKNACYLLQRVSAVVILLFVLFHVLSLKYHAFGAALGFEWDGKAMETIGRHMHAYWFLPLLVYPLGILAAAFHTANGFWTGAITWGLTISAASQKRFAYLCAVIGVAIAVFGIVSIIGALRI